MSRIPASPDFEPRIADWLEADPDLAPPEVLATVLAAFPSIPQRRASRVPRRFQTMNRFASSGRPPRSSWPPPAARAVHRVLTTFTPGPPVCIAVPEPVICAVAVGLAGRRLAPPSDVHGCLRVAICYRYRHRYPRRLDRDACDDGRETHRSRRAQCP